MGKGSWLVLFTFGECLPCARCCWQGWEPKRKKGKNPILKDVTVYWGRRVKENGPREVDITDTKDEGEQAK